MRNNLKVSGYQRKYDVVSYKIAWYVLWYYYGDYND